MPGFTAYLIITGSNACAGSDLMETWASSAPVNKHPMPDTAASQLETVTRIRRAVAALPFDLEGFAYCEVAKILDIPAGTVIYRLHRGRKALPGALETQAGGQSTVTMPMRSPNDLEQLTLNAFVDRELDPEHILLHIDNSTPGAFETVLDYAEGFFAEHRARGMEVEMVTDAGGVDLMRVGGSRYEERVKSLSHRYQNLHFLACPNAIRSLRKQGIRVNALDHVNAEETAIDHIVGRIRSGWKYVKGGERTGI